MVLSDNMNKVKDHINEQKGTYGGGAVAGIDKSSYISVIFLCENPEHK